jgi:hypothetical protein
LTCSLVALRGFFILHAGLFLESVDSPCYTRTRSLIVVYHLAWFGLSLSTPGIFGKAKMKTCSKCKRELPEDQFVKSPRYRDGLYPSCKDCRRQVRRRWLATHPMCLRCGVKPHTEDHQYCYDCQRQADKRNAGPPKFRRDSKNKRCSFCKVNPRLPYHNYCESCKSEVHRKWLDANGGQWHYYSTRGQRAKLIARRYINTQIQRGKLKRQPCEVCGCLETQAHHNDYDKPMDIRWLCKEHHDALHRWLRYKRKQLTLTRSAV